MAMKNPGVGVMLTEEGRAALQSSTISALLVDDSYFKCDSVQQDGYFLLMKLTNENLSELAGVKVPIEISIPMQFVLYTISADAQKVLGFKK